MIEIYVTALTILIGLCVGSFLNVVIYRLPRNMSLAKPASHCPNCEYKLKWYDNIPVFSYLFLRGKCRNCGTKISPRYIVVEILNTVFWFLSLMLNTNYIIPSIQTNYLMFAIDCLASSILICVFCCDLENLEIPDEFQIGLLILGLVSLLSKTADAKSSVFGFLLGGGFLWIVSILFYLLRKKEGLGFGDVKLMAVLGLLLGLKNIILTIILSSVFGAIILLILTLKNKEGANKEYPFATFISIFALIAMFAGNYIVDWYMSLLTNI